MKEQSKSNTSEKKSALLPVVAGCLAGAIEATCVWPMEFMKTRLQLSEKGAKLPYNGTVSGILYTVRTSGKKSIVCDCLRICICLRNSNSLYYPMRPKAKFLHSIVIVSI